MTERQESIMFKNPASLQIILKNNTIFGLNSNQKIIFETTEIGNEMWDVLGKSRVVYFDDDRVKVDQAKSTARRRSSINYKKSLLTLIESSERRMTVVYGCAGTGKSQLLQQIIEDLDQEL